MEKNENTSPEAVTPESIAPEGTTLEIATPEIVVDDILICTNKEKLKGNDVAPPLELEKEYKALETITCGCGKQHIDVGIKSNYNWVSCHSCGEKLPKGDEIHWCHPSRFEIKK